MGLAWSVAGASAVAAPALAARDSATPVSSLASLALRRAPCLIAVAMSAATGPRCLMSARRSSLACSTPPPRSLGLEGEEDEEDEDEDDLPELAGELPPSALATLSAFLALTLMRATLIVQPNSEAYLATSSRSSALSLASSRWSLKER